MTPPETGQSDREVQILEQSNPSPAIRSQWRVVQVSEDGSHWVDHGTYLERSVADSVVAALTGTEPRT